jgi:hypothetical protein
MKTIGEQLRSMKMPSYEAYLASKLWYATKKRLGVGGKKPCPCCKKPAFLELHHVSYQRLGAELSNDIIGVCNECHAAIHMELAIMYQGMRLESQVENTKNIIERATGATWVDATSRWFLLKDYQKQPVNYMNRDFKYRPGRLVGQKERAAIRNSVKADHRVRSKTQPLGRLPK